MFLGKISLTIWNVSMDMWVSWWTYAWVKNSEFLLKFRNTKIQILTDGIHLHASKYSYLNTARKIQLTNVQKYSNNFFGLSYSSPKHFKSRYYLGLFPIAWAWQWHKSRGGKGSVSKWMNLWMTTMFVEQLHHFVMWHVTCDTWHVTHETW